MEWPGMRHLPIEILYAALAILGGIARYLNGVISEGTKFKLGIFFMSAFVSGFSGYMFALLGTTMNLPQPMLFIMAGMGGFFGDQSMKLVYESIQGKLK